ncbi:MAG: FAD-dependent oxidoreductase [Thiohalocapsa sp.]
MNAKTVAIIGAGPVGLAAGAHALERGLSVVILERGQAVGHSILQWKHVKMFSPWEFNVDHACARLLGRTGWQMPNPEVLPTGGELIDQYIAPLGTQTPLKDHIKLASRVTAISRVGFDKLKTAGREQAQFEIRYVRDGEEHVCLADAVIDASGTWFSPNPAGANGLPAIGELAAHAHISYTMPDVLGEQKRRYANRRVAVLGGGHSAVGSILDLVALRDTAPGTDIVWLVRGADVGRSFGGGENDQIAARGALGTKFRHLIENGKIRMETGFGVTHVLQEHGELRIATGPRHDDRNVRVDELIVATGFRPDYSFCRELRLELDPTTECPPMLAPMIDPNIHSCGTVRPHGARELAHPEVGVYIAGMKSFGRAPTFLMITGYEQVRSIVADIVGDKEGAAKVELVLPETGVCSAPLDKDADTTCCDTQPAERKENCCA